MNTWSHRLVIIKHDTRPKNVAFPIAAYGENGVFRIWAIKGFESFYCKLLESYAIKELSKKTYLTLSQQNNLNKLKEGANGNASTKKH